MHYVKCVFSLIEAQSSVSVVQSKREICKYLVAERVSLFQAFSYRLPSDAFLFSCVRRHVFHKCMSLSSPTHFMIALLLFTATYRKKDVFSFMLHYWMCVPSICPYSLGGVSSRISLPFWPRKEKQVIRSGLTFVSPHGSVSSLAYTLGLQRKNMVSATEAVLKNVSRLYQRIPGQLWFELPMEIRPPWGVSLESDSKWSGHSPLIDSPVRCKIASDSHCSADLSYRKDYFGDTKGKLMLPLAPGR